MSTLKEYVTEQLKAGYTKEQLRQTLSAYYPSEQVDAALKGSKTTTIAVPLAIIIIVAVGSMALLFAKTPASIPLSVAATVSPRSVVQGEEFIASIAVTDGLPTKHPANILVTVKDDSGKVIFSQRDFVVVQGEGKRTKVSRAVMQPGTYTIMVEASNPKGEEAKTTTMLTVKKAATTRAIPTPTSTKPTTTRPTLPRGTTPVQQSPTSQNSAVGVSPTTRPEDCAASTDRASCLAQLAATQFDKTVCNRISEPTDKDACLAFFFLHKDFSVCSQLSTEEIRTSCNNLKAFSEGDVPETDLAFTPEEVEVAILDDGFSPAEITITKGTSVVWTNEGENNHDITNDEFSSETLEPGDPFSYIFNNAGTFEYESSIDTDFSGKVIVE